tara:strand:+ start:673 stop:1734 length:1062 start_codon:yes stop_codon:yes gene_type:complete
MATTTTNYAFDVPTSSDLVKNGATAIAELGQDIDTFLFRPFTKNCIVGSMQVWQRGTSFTVLTAGGEYTADRWYAAFSGIAGRTLSRQAGSGQLPYLMRVARDSGNTAVNNLQVGQSLEIADATLYAGQTVTLSYYARKGANYSATSDALVVNIFSGTSSTEANRVTTAYASGGVTDLAATTTLTTTLTRYTHTITFGASVTQFAIKFTFTPTGTAGAADYYEIGGVQLEVGNKATPFTRVGGSIQGELDACMRYFQLIKVGQAWGTFYSTSAAALMVGLPVPMRVTPTATFSTNYTNAITEIGVTDRTPTAYAAYKTSAQAYSFLATGMTSAVAQNGAVWIGAADQQLSSEL